MVDVIIITSNAIVYDPRVEKIVKSLRKRSYSVSALGWNRQPEKLIGKYLVELKLFNFSAPEGKPTLVLRLPIFWIWVFLNLCKYKPSVVHACDLDTVIPSYFYKLFFRKKLLFDLHDRYAMAYIPRKFRMIYYLVNLAEEIFSNKADVLVTVSEKLLSTLKKKPRHSAVVMNCPEDLPIEKEASRDDILRLVYTGPIIRSRGLKEIICAIKEITNIELVIAGIAVDKDLYNYILKFPFVSFRGIMRPRDALYLESMSDIMIILYDLNEPINHFAVPNKLFEAMMCGIPMIINIAPEIVNEVGCGILVDYDNINQIKRAVTVLKNDARLRMKLGVSGRKGFLQKYNWFRMEQQLYKVYDDLLIDRLSSLELDRG